MTSKTIDRVVLALSVGVGAALLGDMVYCAGVWRGQRGTETSKDFVSVDSEPSPDETDTDTGNESPESPQDDGE